MLAFDKQIAVFKKNAEWNKVVAFIDEKQLTDDKYLGELAFAYSKMADNNLPRKNEGNGRADINDHIKYYQKAEELYLGLLTRNPQNLTYLRTIAYFYRNEYSSFSFLTREHKKNSSFKIKSFTHKNTIRNRALFLYFLAHEYDPNDIKTNERYAKLIYEVFNPYNKTKFDGFKDFTFGLDELKNICSINLFNKFKNHILIFEVNHSYNYNNGYLKHSGRYSNAIALIDNNLKLYDKMTEDERRKNEKHYIISLYYYCRWTLDLTKHIPVQADLTYFNLPFCNADAADTYRKEYIVTHYSAPLQKRLAELIKATNLKLNPVWADYKFMLEIIKTSDCEYNMVRAPYYIYYLLAQYYEFFLCPIQNSKTFMRMFDFYRFACECEYTARTHSLPLPEFNDCYTKFLEYFSILEEDYANKFFDIYPHFKNKSKIKDIINYISILRIICDKDFEKADERLKPYYSKDSKAVVISDKKYIKIYHMIQYYKNKLEGNKQYKKYKRFLRQMKNTL